MIDTMIIDENQDYALESFRKTKTGSKVKVADHNSIITKIKAVWKKTEPNTRIEMYNFKDKDGLERFKKLTSSDNFFSVCFPRKWQY